MTTTEPVPIVLLHGVGLDSSMWQSLSRALASRTDQKIIALDLPGHGTQPKLRETVTLDDLVDDIKQRMPDKAHLVGFSVGALIGQRFAQRWPEQISTLICISSVWKRTVQQRQSVRNRLEMASRDFPASVEASIERWYPQEATVSDHDVEATRQVLLANDVASYLRVYEVFSNADAEIGGTFANLTMPVLAVTGSRDTGSTPEMTRQLARAVSNGDFVILDGARHMVPAERPEQLAELIHTFLNETFSHNTTGERHD